MKTSSCVRATWSGKCSLTRQEGGNGQSLSQRNPVRVDRHYMITTWAREPEDEHRLLDWVLMVLFRHESISNSLLPEILSGQ